MVIRLKTVQASSIKGVFEVLKDILDDINIVFTAKGVEILAMDTASVVLVHVFLDSVNFEEYSCPEDITAGVNVSNLFKLLKSVSSQDTLDMSITGRDVMTIDISDKK